MPAFVTNVTQLIQYSTNHIMHYITINPFVKRNQTFLQLHKNTTTRKKINGDYYERAKKAGLAKTCKARHAVSRQFSIANCQLSTVN
jgi:hypothetical protein